MQRLGLGDRATQVGLVAAEQDGEHRARPSGSRPARACRRRGGGSAAPAGVRRCSPASGSTRGRPRRARSPAPAACPSRRPTRPTTSRPSASGIRSPPPSLMLWVGRMSGRSSSSQRIPTSANPSSSSATASSHRSPRGRKPLRASSAIATARAATSFFMSTAPRPHSQPSSSSTASNGGCVQSRGSHGTTSVCPTNASDSSARAVVGRACRDHPGHPRHQVGPVRPRGPPARTRRRTRSGSRRGTPRRASRCRARARGRWWCRGGSGRARPGSPRRAATHSCGTPSRSRTQA